MTIQQEERDVEYGDAVKGDETIALWARMQNLGGTEAGRQQQVDGVPPLVYIIGAPVLIGLVLFCCTLMFNGARQSSAGKTFASRGNLVEDDSTFQGAGSPAHPGASIVIPKSGPTVPSTPVTLTAPMPIPAPAASTPSRTWSSALERDRATDLLADCRVAYDLSSQLSQRWLTTVDNAKIVTSPAYTTVGTYSSSTNAAKTVPRALTNEEWNLIDGEMDGIAGTVGIAAQPSRYPEALQDTSVDFGREMRTFLQTTRAALLETDPQLRTEMMSRANEHRGRAGQLLSTLEGSLKEKVDEYPSF